MEFIIFTFVVLIITWIFDLKQKLSEERMKNINLRFKNEELKKDVESLAKRKKN